MVDYLNEYLRINAVRRMLAVVEVRRSEIAGLISLGVLFTVFEGVGLSLLLPILQYAEGGRTAIIESSGAVWSAIAWLMNLLSLPVTLPVLLALGFVPILARQVVYYGNAWYSAIVAGRIGVRMRAHAVKAVFGADPEFFSRHSVGELQGVVVTQSTYAGNAIVAVIRQLSIGLLMALYIAILFALSVPLAITTMAFAVLVSMLVRANVKRIRAFGLKTARTSQKLAHRIVERFEMMRLIKMRDRAAAESDRIMRYTERLREIDVKQARLGANIEVTADPLLMLSVFVTLYVGIAVLGMTLAQLGLLLFVLSRLNAKVKEFSAGLQLISINVAGLMLVKEMTDDARASTLIRSGPKRFAGLSRQIQFTDVSFDYSVGPGLGSAEVAQPGVLDGVSLTIPAGSLTAIVGRSGAGKSTLVDLLPRLRDVTDGAITFDGVDIREFEVGSLRKGIGYLTQTALLFNDTVRANLCYGLDFEPTDEQITGALTAAFATFAYGLPQGLETSIGDRGVRFSGGERQRIALARVLLADCSVLVLDEPTSALDSESESSIRDALARLHGTRTVVVVAHRLSTVIRADQILVIDEGHVVERGTHEELLALGSAYRRLFEAQLLA